MDHTTGGDAFAGAVAGGGGEGEEAGAEGCAGGEGCEGGGGVELLVVTTEPAPDVAPSSAPIGIDSCKPYS